MIELIIVLAVIAIIAAILIPNFLNTTDKARLKSDVQSARVIKNALDLYNAEQSKQISSLSVGAIIKELGEKGYIDEESAAVQTDGAAWAYDQSTGGIYVDISACPETIRQKVYNQLNEQEKKYVKNASGG